MKIPDGYKTFDSFEDKQKKYNEWGFKSRNKNALKILLYKGVYTEDPYNNPEICDIIGYYTDIRILIELSRSKQRVVIDRRYLKQMQSKTFRQDQLDDDSIIKRDIPQHILDNINIPDSYVIYDLETTGFSYHNDEIIEVAALKIQDGEIIDTFQSLAKPSVEINNVIERLTGITNTMVSSAPDLRIVLQNFKSFISDSVVAGHNIRAFDNGFIATAFFRYGLGFLSNNYFDTLDLARIIYPDLYSYKLSNLVTCMGIPQTEKYHRALADCHYTQKILEHIINDLNNQTATLVTKGSKPVQKKKNSEKSNNNKSGFPVYSDLRNITTQKTDFNPNNPFYKKSCVFTGELKKYSREDAAQIIVDLGGQCENNVTKKTNFLIVSDSSNSDKKSGKQKKAEEYKLKGQDIEIIPESVFYDMISSD